MILDVDGILVDTDYQHALAWYMTFRENDIVVPVWQVHRHLGMGGDQLHGAAPAARAVLDAIVAAGVDLDTVTRELEADGVERFAKAYEGMLSSIADTREQVLTR